MNRQKFDRDYRENYDIYDQELGPKWGDVVEDLELHCPVARSEVGEGYWVIATYDDIRQCAQDWKAFSSMDGYLPNRPSDMPHWYPLECDPPFHDRVRDILNPYLAPLVVAEFEPRIREFADDLIDEMVVGENELVKSYSNALPGNAFCGLVAHMPIEDMPYLSELLHNSVIGPKEGRTPAMHEAMKYMDSFMRRRKEEPPRGDIVDAILEADLGEDNMDGVRGDYDWASRTGTLAQLTLGGLGTSGHVISSALHYLALDDETRERLKQDPSLYQRATDEFLRIFAPSAYDGRRVTKDIEVGERQFHAGDYALFSYAMACRDPRKFDEPREVRIDRFPNPHVAFGAGVHRCIGSHLARLQIRVAIEQFVARVNYRLPDEFQPTYEMAIIRSMLHLPVILDEEPLPR